MKENYITAYKFQKHYAPDRELFRLLHSVNNHAITLCRYRSLKNAERTVHEIRKAMKRIRAVLKLYRPSIPDTFYRSQNILFRDIGRELSEIRVSEVNIKVLSIILNELKSKKDSKTQGKILTDLKNEHARMLHMRISKQKVLQSVSHSLMDNRKHLKEAEGFSCELDQLSEGLRSMHKRCRKYLVLSQQQTNAENLHEFRKPVKYLWNQMKLFRPAWPGVVAQHIYFLDMLGERLGADHDMAELINFLSALNMDAVTDPVIEAIEKKRLHLQHLVWPLANKFFSEKPSSFGDRITAYYAHW